MPVKLIPSRTVNLVGSRGSALVLTVFVLLVMSLLAAALLRMISSSQESIVYEVYGTRALMAANSGIEAMANQIFPITPAATTPAELTSNDCDAVTLAQPVNLTTTPGLENCSFTASCQDSSAPAPADSTIQIDTTAVVFYRFTSIGTCASADGEITATRRIQVSAKVPVVL